MYHSRFTCVFLLILTFSTVSIFAQTSPTESQTEKENAQKEREKKAIAILERTVNQASFLKLPDNRALVYASAGDLVWERDEKRGRQLFRQAASELVQANNAPEDDSGSPFAIFSNPSPRKQILTTIAKHDAEMALELLLSTRPPNVAAALAASSREKISGQNQKKNAQTAIEDNQNRFLVSQELSLEQSFSAKAAEENPQKAVKMLRESIDKNGVTNAVFDFLSKINKKDNKLAVELADEITQELSETDFSKKEEQMQISSNFLKNYYLDAEKNSKKADNAKPIKISESRAKNLANKIADYLTKEAGKNSMELYFQSINITPVLEKIIPERSASLKQTQEKIKKLMPEEFTRFAPDISNTEKSNIERAIERADRLPAQMRGSMYKNAINGAATSGELDKAREALLKIPAGKDRDEALNYLDSKSAEQKIKDGKFDEARKIIDNLTTKQEKVERLVQLAIAFQAKNTEEDKDSAQKLMIEAENMVDNIPQDEDGVKDYLRIASGYAFVEPKKAFAMLDTFSYQVNDIVNASALLAKYNKRDRSFDNGELILTRGLPQIGNAVYQYGEALNQLAKEDINRLEGITSKFQRDDARVLLQIYIVQAFFNEKIGLEGGAASSGNLELFGF